MVILHLMTIVTSGQRIILTLPVPLLMVGMVYDGENVLLLLYIFQASANHRPSSIMTRWYSGLTKLSSAPRLSGRMT